MNLLKVFPWPTAQGLCPNQPKTDAAKGKCYYRHPKGTILPTTPLNLN